MAQFIVLVNYLDLLFDCFSRLLIFELRSHDGQSRQTDTECRRQVGARTFFGRPH